MVHMSLGVVIKGSEGVVLATESRITLEARRADSGGQTVVVPVTFDNASKLLTFGGSGGSAPNPHGYVAAVTYGAAVIGTDINDLRTAPSYLPELEGQLGSTRKTTLQYAELIRDFFVDQWSSRMPAYQGPPMTFVVGGYDKGEAYGSVFVFDVPQNPDPRPMNPDNFGITWGGQREYATRLVFGYDPALPELVRTTLNLDDADMSKLTAALEQLRIPVPYSVLPLQDCIDFAIYLIRATMQAQAAAIGIRGVGGPIDVATITRSQGVQFIQRKVPHGEREY